MKITAITTTAKTTRTIGKTGRIIEAGTTWVTGVRVDTLDGVEAGLRADAVRNLAYRLRLSKDKTEIKSIKERLKAEEARGILSVKGTEFLLLLSGVSQVVNLDNDGKAALGRILKGLIVDAELVALNG